MFERSEVSVLVDRLREPRRFMQLVMGPRQVGKTSAVTQAISKSSIPSIYCSAEHVYDTSTWISSSWEDVRHEMRLKGLSEIALVLDGVEQIPNWPEAVKAEWDRDTREKTNIKVVLIGSSRIWNVKGLTESLAGRFEEIRMTRWTLGEMQNAFGFGLDDYIYYGGYPGAAPLLGDDIRRRSYIQSSVVDTSLTRDILVDSHIAKPGLLRRSLQLGTMHSGEILSLTQLMAKLPEAGNTTTLTGYFAKLGEAGLVRLLSKFSGGLIRKRASIPKFQVFDNALKSLTANMALSQAKTDHLVWKRYVKSAVGAHLINEAWRKRFEVYYWQDGGNEVDFILNVRGKTIAVCVQGNMTKSAKGLEAFRQKFDLERLVIVGESGISLETFLKADIADLWR